MKNLLRFALLAAIAGGCAPSDFAKDDGALQTTELAIHADSSSDGGPFRGELALCDWSSDALTERNAYHFWTFETDGCGDALVDLASRAGDDTYLLLYRQVGAAWRLVARNDDCYDGTLNSCYEGALEAGTYLVGVATYDFMRYGAPTAADYQLRVVCRDAGACEPELQACGSRGLEPCGTDEYCDFGIEAMCGAADHPGVCRSVPHVCAEVHEPVCGCDGRDYPNACAAAQHGISVQSEGACPIAEGEFCGGIAGIQCGSGLVCDYSVNGFCGADLGGVCVVDEITYCTREYAPVCGCDGRTYGNDCERRSAHVAFDHEGECR